MIRFQAVHEILVPCFVLLALATGVLPAGAQTANAAADGAPAGLDPSTFKDAIHSLDLGLRWLDEQQKEDGSWSQGAYPALTALAVMAHELDPRRAAGEAVAPPASRGIDYILKCARPDGGIYVPSDQAPPLPHYNTALSTTALVLSGDPRHRPFVEKGEQFLVGGQHLGEDIYGGGFGYETGGKREYADLSNTVMAIEAIYAAEKSRPADQTRAPGERQLDWPAAIRFISRVQNLPGSNDQPWAQDVTKDDWGGFAYHPDESKAGEETSDDGSRRFHSYGSMTYAGLLSFIYADVNRDDPRVQAAVDWIRRHYTVDENPGMGAQGQYYGYHTMAKALANWGECPLVLAGGTKADWRTDLTRKLISLQRIDPKTGLGYWVNDNGRWWENDPVLATCYALITLEILLGRQV